MSIGKVKNLSDKLPVKILIKKTLYNLIKLSYLSIGVVIFITAYISVFMSSMSLPKVENINSYLPNETSVIYAGNKIIGKLHDEENRTIIQLKDIPPYVKNAVLAMEDRDFYKHYGIEPTSIVRAGISIVDPTDSIVKGGGSTITQQLVRNVFLTRERTFKRKFSEWMMAVKLERELSKDEILELYLNQVYWGHNAYGIEAASKVYFGKSVKQLNLAEASLIGGLLSSPEVYSPYKNMDYAKWRQSLTLQNMVSSGFINQSEANQAKKTPIKLIGLNRSEKITYPYFTSYVISILKKKYGPEILNREGLKVYTTLDPKAQEIAEDLINKKVKELKKLNIHEGALVSIDPKTGFIKALVGGTDYNKTVFNRVTQSLRQPGSTFKPFVYLTAFNEKVLTPDSIVIDEPLKYKNWSPKNYGGTFSGPMTVTDAIKFSVNIPAVKTIERLKPETVVETAEAVGIKTKLNPYLSLALGSSEVTPLELASAYSVFATGGKKPEQITPILKIVDNKGFVLEDNTKQKLNQVYDPYPVFLLNQTLKAVVREGTGTAASIPGRVIAGKTGTTSDHRDSWFVGYIPQLVTLVWVGNDDNTVMKHATGGTVVAPIWKEYMSQVTRGMKVENFPKATLKDSMQFHKLRRSLK